VIVRISGVGQYELDDDGVHKLNDLDTALTDALHASREDEFQSLLQQTIEFVENQGKEVGLDRVVPSDVIVPPADITMTEAQQFFTDEGLMQPLPA
jgi:hypothetical protein